MVYERVSAPSPARELALLGVGLAPARSSSCNRSGTGIVLVAIAW